MKYKLTEEFIEKDGIKLFRIEALVDIPRWGVKKGDLGGYIDKEESLAQDGSWVERDSTVKDSTVKDSIVKDSRVRDSIVEDSTVKDSIVKDSIVKDSTVRDSRIRHHKILKSTDYMSLILDGYRITITKNYIQIGYKEFSLEKVQDLESVEGWTEEENKIFLQNKPFILQAINHFLKIQELEDNKGE